MGKRDFLLICRIAAKVLMCTALIWLIAKAVMI